ncbi:MAG TPA: hypothetical protein VLQ93_06490, partial [Myxococcaceae bacterium]|nr:hypothetical protein [Myxococcaceae bacterium]
EGRSGERYQNGRPPRQEGGGQLPRGEGRSGERYQNGRPPRQEGGGQFRRGERPAGPPREPKPQGRSEQRAGRSGSGPRQGRGGGPVVSYTSRVSAKAEDESGS